MKKCGMCRKAFNLPLFDCSCLKEGWHPFSKPPYKNIERDKILKLCVYCKDKQYKFSDKYYQDNPKQKNIPFYPITIMRYEEECRLEELWLGKEAKDYRDRMTKERYEAYTKG